MRKFELEELLRQEAEDVRVKGEETWSIVCQAVVMHVFINEAKDRMRVIAAIGPAKDLERDQIYSALESGFHGDARYGVYEDQVYAVYLHRLSSLTRTDLRDALEQVASLFNSFGSSYAGSRMHFDWPRPEQLGRSLGGVRRVTEEAVEKSLHRQEALQQQEHDDEPDGSQP